MEKIKGEITSVFFQKNGYSVGKILCDEISDEIFAGNFSGQVGDQVELFGSFVMHPKFGNQFKVESFRKVLEFSGAGLEKWLAKNKDFKMIGPKRARKIVKTFGNNFQQALTETPELIAKTIKVPLRYIVAIQEKWLSDVRFNEVMTKLLSFGLSQKESSIILEKYGEAVFSVLEKNPYCLIYELDGFGFKRVDGIAKKVGIQTNNPERIYEGLKFLIYDNTRSRGSTWIAQSELLQQARKLLELDSIDDLSLILEQALRLQYCSLKGGETAFFNPEFFDLEKKVFKVFIERSNNFSFSKDEIFGLDNSELTNCQSTALRGVMDEKISLITGGAGTGKTFLIRKIAEHSIGVTLLAPTGKAAKRVEEATGFEASTIHRFLKYDGQSFNFEGLISGLIIIDEFSMVDVALCATLFDFIDWGCRETKVVLVGDPNQLPPVGPGNILRDIIRHDLIPVFPLNQVVRQSGILKQNCCAILSGTVADTHKTPGGVLSPWYKLSQFREVSKLTSFLEDFFQNILAGKLGKDPVRDVQLITPIHSGPLGTIELNRVLQKCLKRSGKHVTGSYGIKLFKGDKVIQIKNDYGLGVMNGTIGYIDSVDSEENGLWVYFEDDLIYVNNEKVDSLRLAYAITCHKFQGSEVPVSVVICHKSHSFMTHRNWLYTAVTRARESVVLVGDWWGIDQAVQKVGVDERQTVLDLLGRKEIE